MRGFFLISHGFSGDVALNDLPGSGRIDVVARCITSSIFLSHSIRKDVIFHVFFPKLNILMSIDSQKVKYLNPDERSTAALINHSLIRARRGLSLNPGFSLKNGNLEEVLEEISKENKIYYLREDGKDIRDVDIENNPLFILSDSVNPDKSEEEIILKKSEKIINVSPRSLLASQAITIVNNELDRRGI